MIRHCWVNGVVAFLFAMLSPVAARAEIVINESTEYYDIEGQTLRDLQHQMRKKGPPHDGDGYAIAVTKTRLRYDYSYKQRGKNCNLVGVKTIVDIIIVYPRWVDNYAASDRLLNDWEKFMDHVADHEGRHSTYSLETAYALDSEMEQLTEILPCGELKAAVREIIDRHNQELKRKNKEFHAEVYKKRQ